MSQLNLEIKTKLEELEQALLAQHPTMPQILRDIHRTLKAQPDQVTLMSEEEINTVIRGLEKQTNSYIAASVSKPKAAAKASLKKVSADDLGF